MGKYERNYGTSPIFSYDNAALTDSNIKNVTWESADATSKKYLPFDSCLISNNGEDDIIVYPNQNSSSGILVRKNTEKAINRNTVPAWSSFGYKRNGTTNITASTVKFSFWKEGVDSDSVARLVHKRIFG